MDLLTATVAERPDLAQLLDDFNPWPRFMHQDPVSSLYCSDPVGMYPEFVLAAIDQDHPGQLVAKAYSLPFTWDADPAVSLPRDGWDGVILTAAIDRLAGRRGNLISALEISIRKDLQGSGLSRIMLGAMRENAAALGFTSLVAPVRQSQKHRFGARDARARGFHLAICDWTGLRVTRRSPWFDPPPVSQERSPVADRHLRHPAPGRRHSRIGGVSRRMRRTLIKTASKAGPAGRTHTQLINSVP